MAKVRGILRDGFVYVEADFDKLYRQGYGEIVDGSLEMHPLEASYLVWEQKMEVFDENGKNISFEDLLTIMINDPATFLKYVVYSDLRRRSRLVVYERATEFLRLYPKGASIGERASKQLILPLSEDQPISHDQILASLEKVMRLRKELILAVVDDEMNVTYYEIEKFSPKPRESNLKDIPEKSGVLIGDRVLIFEDPSGLYSRGFWGHPIGIEKPEPFKDYEQPLQLPLIEALYLVSRGKLKVRDPKGDIIGLEELRNIFSGVRDNAEVKERVFSYWRDLGYIPKAGSKYGVDYMIYERGPGLEHAPYLCIASDVRGKIKPIDLIRAGRLATSVRKELVVSLVSGEDILSYKLRWFKP
jgi:tRNA-intron endonuclease